MLGKGHGVGRPCAAALDADALDAILRNASKWDGTRALMRDVWRGHKEDSRKAHIAAHFLRGLL